MGQLGGLRFIRRGINRMPPVWWPAWIGLARTNLRVVFNFRFSAVDNPSESDRCSTTTFDEAAVTLSSAMPGRLRQNHDLVDF